MFFPEETQKGIFILSCGTNWKIAVYRKIAQVYRHTIPRFFKALLRIVLLFPNRVRQWPREMGQSFQAIVSMGQKNQDR